MEFPTVVYNGVLTPFSSLMNKGEDILSQLYLYQNIHIYESKALFLERHLYLISKNCETFFNREFLCDDISSQIDELLRANSCTRGSYAIRLYLWRDDYMLTVNERLIYPNFTLWHTRFSAQVIKCENPFAGVSSMLSLATMNYALSYAEGKVCLCANLDDMITGVGDAPVFFVKNNVVYSTPIKYGVTASVERQLAIEAIARLGFDFEQKPIYEKDLSSFDEIFYVNTQGLVAIKDYGAKVFFAVVAQRFADVYGRVF